MRVYISADIEGICGVVNGDYTHNKGYLYAAAREQMTAEVNAAIEGAFNAGATEVVVNDSHGPMVNLIPMKLHKEAKLIQGTPKPLVMMEGIDDGQFDAAMFIGYHARNNSPGVLSHTISGGSVDNIWINDVLVGETGFNAALAGHFDVPLVLVSGDNMVSQEAKDLLGNVETVIVKEALTRYSAKNLHPEKACELIRAAAEKALSNLSNYQPFKVETPVTGKIQFMNTGLADGAARLPGAVRVSGDTLTYTADDYLTVFKALRAMIALAR